MNPERRSAKLREAGYQVQQAMALLQNAGRVVSELDPCFQELSGRLIQFEADLSVCHRELRTYASVADVLVTVNPPEGGTENGGRDERAN